MSEEERKEGREFLTSNTSIVLTDESYTFNLKNGFLTFFLHVGYCQSYCKHTDMVYISIVEAIYCGGVRDRITKSSAQGPSSRLCLSKGRGFLRSFSPAVSLLTAHNASLFARGLFWEKTVISSRVQRRSEILSGSLAKKSASKN